jgi:hypothetical protein
MKIIDEKMAIQNLINSEDIISDSPSQSELNLLAKHFRSIGKGAIGIKKELLEYCSSRFTYFNPVIFRESINNAVRIGMRSEPKSPREVLVTQGELDEIRTVPCFKLQKILFSMLVFVKAFNPDDELGIFSNGINFSNLRWILKVSDTRMSFPEFMSYLYYLETCGLLFVRHSWKANSTLTSLSYVESFYPESHVLKITGSVDELENAGTIYKDFVGGVLYWCTMCGREGIKNSNRQTRCETCAQEMDKMRKR